jgi:hypothetical protein
VHSRRAGRDHDTIEVVLGDVTLDGPLARVGAGVLLIASDHHPRLGLGMLDEGPNINGTGDVGAAMTDINANSSRHIARYEVIIGRRQATAVWQEIDK